jgi:hypothetical protein
VIWIGFWINALSGGIIMASHATTMFTNWVMYIKLASIIVAVLIIRRLYVQVFRSAADGKALPSNVNAMAGALLCLWFVAITAGRLTAYFGSLRAIFTAALR